MINAPFVRSNEISVKSNDDGTITVYVTVDGVKEGLFCMSAFGVFSLVSDLGKSAEHSMQTFFDSME